MTATDHGPAPAEHARDAWPRSPLFFFLGIFVFVGLLIGAVFLSGSLGRPDVAGDMDALPEPSEVDTQSTRDPGTEEYPEPLSFRGGNGSVAGG